MHKTIKELENYLVLANYSKAICSAYVSATTNFYKWCIVNKNQPNFYKSQAHRLYLVARSKKGLAWKRSMEIILQRRVRHQTWNDKHAPYLGTESGKLYIGEDIGDLYVNKSCGYIVMGKHSMYLP
ncbi:MAG: hypothetical protein ACI8YQ_002945 [Polaribacter sp.]|jgi:hypothetical protein